MKVLFPLLISAGILCFSAAKAEQTPQNHCNNDQKCFYLDRVALLPQGKLSEYPNYASLGSRFNTGGERAFVFDPRNKRWGAYDKDGYLVANGIANGGADHCADLGRSCHTPRGVFRVGRKGTSACVSNKFPKGIGGAPMPYCMFFRGGYAIHGSPYISNRNGSHGCVRVHTAAAAWLHKHFMRSGTKVIVLPY